LYIGNQSTFNENIASFIADKLTEQYIETRGLTKSPEWASYSKQRERAKEVRERMARAFQDLSAIYSSTDPDPVKLEKKTGYLKQLQEELKFRRPINNATLILYKTYDPSDQGFQALYERCGKNIREFLARLEKLKPSDFEGLGCKKQCEKFKALIDRL
jgi:predicted aminopeptidase